MTQMLSKAQKTTRRLQTRRVAGFLIAAVVAPGLVQIYTGAAQIGRIAMRIWGATWAASVLLICGFVFFRGPTIMILLNPGFLWTAKLVAFLVVIGWIALLLDSWRRLCCFELAQVTRVISGAVAGILVLAMVSIGTVVAHGLTAMGDVGSIFLGTGDTRQQNGRYNVLLLGGDSGPSREGMRPDSIMVASIDAKTGRTVLIGLPRNMEGARIPASNPLHKLYPKGYDCPQSKCMLNGIYTLANEHKSLFPGVIEPGLKSMQDVVGEVLGLKINYYALIDLAGFESLIDAVGGINLDVGRRIPIGGGTSKVSGYIEPGKNQHLDGYHALWFARSRHGSTDYDRMARQKCVLNAMLRQLDPTTVATRFGQLAKAGASIVRTSVPTSEISKLVELALRAKKLPTASVSLTPPLIHPGRPDFDFIISHVAEAIKKSEALDGQVEQTPTKSTPVISTTSAAPTLVQTPSTVPSQSKRTQFKSNSSQSKKTAHAVSPQSISPNQAQKISRSEPGDLTAVCSVSG